ncbi:hypothetical protein [Brucella intermedia]|jgi:hypothetical protein|uniref:hypothetical protein n=1 Tax=Brucella intermedia TaxID=94625 RepID=UPI0022499FCC|nr:hypothetical protein [Brucella intermedia]
MKKIKLLILTVCGVFALTIIPFKSNADTKSAISKEITISNDYVKILEEYSEYPDEISKYLYSLSNEELINAIRDVSEYLEEKDIPTNMMVFVSVAKDNLMKNLKEDDYIKIINDDKNSDLMRMFFIDMYNSSGETSVSYNKYLRNIVKNTNENPEIRTYSLTSIKDLGKEDVPMLKDILNSSVKSEEFKAFALQNYTKINPEEAIELNMDILSNYENYSDREVLTSMKSISKVYYKDMLKNESAPNIKTISGTKSNNFNLDEALNKIDNILSNTDKGLLKDGATFALSDMKNEKALDIVIKNKKNIDDYVIKDVIDQNFTTVKSMIKSGENIDLALECIDIMPMKEFKDLLNTVKTNNSFTNKLKSNNSSKSISDLEDKIEKNNYKHNSKWDMN